LAQYEPLALKGTSHQQVQHPAEERGTVETRSKFIWKPEQ